MAEHAHDDVQFGPTLGELRADRVTDPDEWEHLCAGGSTTLWRWGDDVPSDMLPTDVSPAEAAWRRAWAKSGGMLARPEGGFPAAFEAHRRPNAFGLSIAAIPYLSELTAAPGVTRGGDGGCTICGGAGILLGWLPLATSYGEPDDCEHGAGDVVDPGHTVARRVSVVP